MKKRKAPSQEAAELWTAAARILQWFFSFPDNDWTLTEICVNTQTAKKTASPIIEDFIARGLVLKNTFGRSWRLMSNARSPLFTRMKIAANFTNVYAGPVVDHVRAAYPQARAIILFGSFRKGEDGRASDLDIAVEIPGLSQPKQVEAFQVVSLGYRPQVKVNLQVFSRDSVDINLFANIANGIVLDGFLEVRP